MSSPQKYSLRTLTEQEERVLSQMIKASSERVDVVRRAKALITVHTGVPFAEAACQSGFKSADSVSQLVQRFNVKGLAALLIAPGRGRKPSYTSQERQRILEELHREPDREQDQSATWSLKLLERALRKRALPAIGASTIRRVLTRVRVCVRTKPHVAFDRDRFAGTQNRGGQSLRSTSRRETTFDRVGLSHC